MTTGNPADPLDVYAEHLDSIGLDRSTRVKYARDVRGFLEDHPKPWVVDERAVAIWLEHRPTPRATEHATIALRSFYRWAVRAGHTSTSPVPAVRQGRRGPAAKPFPELWAEEVEAFCTYLRAGAKSETTIGLRRKRLQLLAENVEHPWLATSDQLAEYMTSRGWKAETKRSARSTFLAFYAWAVATGRIEASPAATLAPVRPPRARPRPAATGALVEALDRSDDRVRLMLMLGAYAGLRRMEIARLHAYDVRDGVLSIVGKGGKHRYVPLHPDLAAALEGELELRRAGGCGSGWRPHTVSATGWLFPSDDASKPIEPRWVGRLMATALPGDWTAHTLRHRFATQAYAAERDLRAVQELMGHTSPTTTAGYTALPSGALRAAVAGVGL